MIFMAYFAVILFRGSNSVISSMTILKSMGRGSFPAAFLGCGNV
jgi:hypothetical protein